MEDLSAQLGGCERERADSGEEEGQRSDSLLPAPTAITAQEFFQWQPTSSYFNYDVDDRNNDDQQVGHCNPSNQQQDQQGRGLKRPASKVDGRVDHVQVLRAVASKSMRIPDEGQEKKRVWEKEERGRCASVPVSRTHPSSRQRSPQQTGSDRFSWRPVPPSAGQLMSSLFTPTTTVSCSSSPAAWPGTMVLAGTPTPLR